MYRCLPYKTYGVRRRFGNFPSIKRQIQKYVANHNKDGPKTKLKMKKFLTALSSVLYFMFYFPPYVLYGKRVVHFEKWTGGGKSTLISFISLQKTATVPGSAIMYCILLWRVYCTTSTKASVWIKDRMYVY